MTLPAAKPLTVDARLPHGGRRERASDPKAAWICIIFHRWHQTIVVAKKPQLLRYYSRNSCRRGLPTRHVWYMLLNAMLGGAGVRRRVDGEDAKLLGFEVVSLDE